MEFGKGNDAKTWDSLRGAAAGKGPRKKPTYYEVLDVEFNAPRSKIRESYIRLKNTFTASNPALYSLMGDEEAKENLAEIEEAFRVLQDDLLRKRYNQGLAAEGFAVPSAAAAEPARDPFKETASASDLAAEGDLVAMTAAPRRDAVAAEPREAAAPTAEARTRGQRDFAMAGRVANLAHGDEMKQKIAAMLAAGEAGDGVVLGKIRELLKVSIQEIQERTKISPEYVLAIEANFYHKLPALVYTRGFLKCYLQYLGIPDANAILTAYVEKIKAWQAKNPNS